MVLTLLSPYPPSIISNVQILLLLICERSRVFLMSSSSSNFSIWCIDIPPLFRPNATSSLRSSESVSLSYPCSCVGHIQAVPSVPALPCSKINGAGSLVKWARAKVASTSNQALPRSCGGKVIVTVLDDNSHTLEILGQQIIVRVEHPNV